MTRRICEPRVLRDGSRVRIRQGRGSDMQHMRRVSGSRNARGSWICPSAHGRNDSGLTTIRVDAFDRGRPANRRRDVRGDPGDPPGGAISPYAVLSNLTFTCVISRTFSDSVNDADQNFSAWTTTKYLPGEICRPIVSSPVEPQLHCRCRPRSVSSFRSNGALESASRDRVRSPRRVTSNRNSLTSSSTLPRR